MPVILKSKPDESIIAVRDMVDGQIGVIVEWSYGQQTFNGRVVQRSGHTIFTIGMGGGQVWDNCEKLTLSCNVRLLKKGEILEVEQ
jgi:hypothetical protein